jgi:tetratricopeptide (TPR) repeat protein
MLPWYNLLNDASEMMDAGRYDLAEPALRQIVAADDQYFLAHGDLGRCLLRLKKTDEAIMHLKRNVELDPGADRVRAMLGAALFLKGDYEAAVTELETTLRLNPELYETQYNLGLSLEKLQRNDEASKAYRECLRIVPYFTPAQQRLQEIKNR